MDARHSRQVALPGFGAQAQSALAAARVLVIGAGGLGSSVIPSLAGAGVGTIGIVDDDIVELSNLHRQHVHGVADLGDSKVASAARAIAAIDPDVRVIAVGERFAAANAQAIAAGFDLIVDGSDNFPTRYLANDVAALAGIPLVWGAVSQYGGQVGVAWAERGPQYRDLFPTPPPPGSVLSCEDGGVLPTTVAIIGSIMATEVLKIVTGVGTPLVGRVTTYDALTGGFREIGYARDESAQPITGLIDYEAFCGLPAASTTISADALAAELATGTALQLIDVREPWEAEIAHLEGARLVPLGALEQRIDELDSAAPTVVFCHHGVRSAAALEILRAAGFRDIRHLTGGIDDWTRRIDPDMARY